ncbi:MAG: hypothetical protein ACRDPR_14380 [Nocardioidaceae bacterium]
MHAVGDDAFRWARTAKATGWLGIGSSVLIFVPVIAISSLGEPPLEASTPDVATFFQDADTAWVQAAQATTSLGMVAFLWFVVGIAAVLRRAEGEPAWRSTIALVSGVLVATYGVLDASWDAAIHRGDEIDPGLAAYAFDVGNLGFANAWLAVASLAVAAGWVTLGTGVFPRWTGWCALTAGVGLVVARYLWFVEGLWFAPYALFWVWAIGVSVLLLRRPVERVAPLS